MKIKVNKQVNLPQLIEYAWDNDIKNEIFIADKQLINIEFDDTGDVLIYGNGSIKTVKFSIEVEEEITEDTVFDNLIEINELIDFKKEGLLGGVRLYKNSSINQVENDKSVAYYIMNDDLEMTLIWKRKEGLVE